MAYVSVQYGDAPEVVLYAIKNCPSNAISLIPRDTLPLLEYAMTKCSKLRARASVDPGAEPLPTPEEIYQDFLIDDLLDMDMERALSEDSDPLADGRLAEELSDTARGIYQAACLV